MEDTDTSGYHANLYVDRGFLILLDNNSTNGTWVNRERMTGPKVILPDDLIHIAGTDITARALDFEKTTVMSDPGAFLRSYGSGDDFRAPEHPPPPPGGRAGYDSGPPRPPYGGEGRHRDRPGPDLPPRDRGYRGGGDRYGSGDFGGPSDYRAREGDRSGSRSSDRDYPRDSSSEQRRGADSDYRAPRHPYPPPPGETDPEDEATELLDFTRPPPGFGGPDRGGRSD
jgi:hypothetical protein